MVLETLVISPLNQLTRLVAREYFIINYTEFVSDTSTLCWLREEVGVAGVSAHTWPFARQAAA
jgi:hypothetical protein